MDSLGPTAWALWVHVPVEKALISAASEGFRVSRIYIYCYEHLSLKSKSFRMVTCIGLILKGALSEAQHLKTPDGQIDM